MKTHYWMAAMAALPLVGLDVRALNDPGLVDFGGPNAETFVYGATVGWSFRVSQDYVVTSLGFYDTTPDDALDQDHLIGIWQDAGALMGSATVLTEAPIDGAATAMGGRFRWVTLGTPFTLAAGQTYVIGAQVYEATTLSYAFVDTVVTSPNVEYLQSRYSGGEPAVLILTLVLGWVR